MCPFHNFGSFFLYYFKKKKKTPAGLTSDQLKTSEKENQNIGGTKRSSVYDNDNSLQLSSSSPPLSLSSDQHQDSKNLPPLKTVRLDNDKAAKETLHSNLKSQHGNGGSLHSTSPRDRSKNPASISDREWFEGQRFNPFNTEVIFEEDHYSEVESTSKNLFFILKVSEFIPSFM